jgi:predicted MPP superfamily phosphohydrolase
VFGGILLTVITILHVYVFWRASSVPLLKRHIPRKFLIRIGLVLWMVFFFGRFIGHGNTGIIAVSLEFLGMTWMAVVFLMTVTLLMVDIVTGFGFVLPRPAPFLRGCALAAGVVLSVIALVQGLRPPVIQHYDVDLSGLPPEMDGTVIVAMSDLHAGTLISKRWLEARVAQVMAQQPDLIFLLGDILEGHDEPKKELLAVLHRLTAPLGVWAVLGNHEFHGSNNTSALMNYDGIRVLNNSWAEVRPSLILAGVEDLTANHRLGQGDDPISKALTGRPPGATILLSHTPWQTGKIARDGVGLMLSGHTHGGQIWPFGYLVQRIYPLLGGRYDVDGMTVIVCRGTGTWGPRMRLWRPGEILSVTLHPGNKGQVEGVRERGSTQLPSLCSYDLVNYYHDQRELFGS